MPIKSLYMKRPFLCDAFVVVNVQCRWIHNYVKGNMINSKLNPYLVFCKFSLLKGIYVVQLPTNYYYIIIQQ